MIGMFILGLALGWVAMAFIAWRLHERPVKPEPKPWVEWSGITLTSNADPLIFTSQGAASNVFVDNTTGVGGPVKEDGDAE